MSIESKNQRKKPKEETVESCPICFKSPLTNPTVNLPCGCSTCVSCLSQWIISKIRPASASLDSLVPCLSLSCRLEFRVGDVFTKLPIESQNRINEALLQTYLKREKDIRACPEPGCFFAGILPSSTVCQEKLKCDACGTLWRDKKHLSMIEKLMRISSPIRHSYFLVTQYFRTKACPQCGVYIQKEEGCEGMTCSECEYRFCWTCSTQFPNHRQVLHELEPVKNFLLNLLMIALLMLVLYISLSFPFLKEIFRLISLWIWNIIEEPATWIFNQSGKLILLNFGAINTVKLLSRFPDQWEDRLEYFLKAGTCWFLIYYFGVILSTLYLAFLEAVLLVVVIIVGLVIDQKYKWIKWY